MTQISMFTQISRVIATRADFLNDDFYNDIIALSSAKKYQLRYIIF